MRLWHKSLIQVLPQKQLIAQWRELSAIAGSIQKNGTPNHPLVNYVTAYDYDHFISYAALVREELLKRNYKASSSVWNKICSLKPNYQQLPFEEIYAKQHSVRYLRQCCYNLQEKFDCGIVDVDDWDKIKKRNKIILN